MRMRAATIITRTTHVMRVAVVCALLAATADFVSPAQALSAGAAPAPHWALTAEAAPTYFHRGDSNDFYEATAINDGAASTNGEITVTFKLPIGVVATAVEGLTEPTIAVRNMQCSEPAPTLTGTVTCTTTTSVPSDHQIRLKINVEVEASASETLTSEATISGGGAKLATSVPVTTPVVPESHTVPYGATFESDLVNAGGEPESQAGSHPFAVTTLLTFNTGSVSVKEECYPSSCPQPVGDPKDIEVALPPGLVGNPTALPRCTQADFHEQGYDPCPADTQVGYIYLSFYGYGTAEQPVPVYNVEPPPGQPAELGFSVSTLAHIPMFFHVRSNGDYGLTADISEINQGVVVRRAILTIWGTPAAESHDYMRESSVTSGTELGHSCSRGNLCRSDVAAKPFLTMPSRCTVGGETLDLPLAGDSWQQPSASPRPLLATGSIGSIIGCELIAFDPVLEVVPSTLKAGAPSGYEVNLGVPQNEEVEGLATSDVNDVEVMLPEGTVISPSGANGLVACSESQLDPKVEAEGQCPRESKVASVTIKTPLLSEPLTGNLYIGQPKCSPCSGAQAERGEMVNLYLEAAGSGVRIKLIGDTQINQKTGRLTAVFKNNPQLPFNELKVNIEDGEDAPLANPSTCGFTAGSASLTPWSSSIASNISAPGFSVTSCPSPSFAPSFEAGMTSSVDGGAYSSFSVTFRRDSGEDVFGAITVNAPPGLLGDVSHVVLCPEAQANAGTCETGSQIGEASAYVGPGAEPYLLKGGKVYLTEKYGAAPFGLSIVMPAEAGPFRLAGNTGLGTEVVRAAINVNPITAAISITSGPLPTELDGIPLRIQAVNVKVNRKEFMFNATNCNAQAISGTITSPQGATAKVATPYRAVNCAAMPFRPGLTATTRAYHSRKAGAYLKVQVTSGSGQANIAKVHVTLPKKLPSDLATLKLACVEQQFAINPSGCPKGSFVGTATAYTPVLSKALSGPAIFVSHGHAKFPDLDFVLQGEGVTVMLEGNTFIGKKGFTSSSFNSVPDVPITSFELVLPQGSNPALSGDGNLCASALKMPTIITGQNGAVIRRVTHIEALGCSGRIVLSSYNVKGRAVTLKVIVPGAGKFVARGKGLSHVTKRITGRQTITARLKQKSTGKLLKTRVVLSFDPSKGPIQRKGLSITFKK